ncbi:hypothetical protein SNOG_10080 [Parastagonospora nodorum SN15]|uniref:Uncharacterized protein n=1 Tax=Phaeosphaeria nodorum (strain SN15 / ATCC MYA-4574 / FGSC 10173) TaxID=321614 RepID=Q0UDT4_PHANO|nr:hypothetical protein SNOG_10080 [Parastagonospora nodorum SN15]EAT82415.1 hypothetical protein SNOG_10080 [Parastagonospora nodorum SN15]
MSSITTFPSLIVGLVHASTVMSIDLQFHIIYPDSSQVVQVGYDTEERK